MEFQFNLHVQFDLHVPVDWKVSVDCFYQYHSPRLTRQHIDLWINVLLELWIECYGYYFSPRCVCAKLVAHFTIGNQAPHAVKHYK